LVQRERDQEVEKRWTLSRSQYQNKGSEVYHVKGAKILSQARPIDFGDEAFRLVARDVEWFTIAA
jgi:hypothetical protein